MMPPLWTKVRTTRGVRGNEHARPKALVTAAVSGPGLDLLHQLADLVLDSWLDLPQLRIYNAQQLAARVADEGANIVVVEGDSAEPSCTNSRSSPSPAAGVTPPTSMFAAATAAGVPVLARSGPQCRRRGRAGRRPPLRRHPGPDPGRPGRPGRGDLPRREDPLPALPGLGTGRKDRRAWSVWARWAGPCAGACAAWAWMSWPTTPTPPMPPARSTSCSSAADVISVHAPVTQETTGMIGKERVRQDAGRRGLPQHGPGQDPRHRCPGRRRCGRARWAPPGSTTSRASTWRPTTR